MKGKTTKKQPQIIYAGGEPSAVIIDINLYQEMLERLEDIEDLNMLKKIRSNKTNFRKFDDFLSEAG